MNSTVVSSIQLKSILRKIQGESGPLVTAFDRDRWHLFQHTGGSYGVWPSAMAVAAPVIPWHRAHLYKALVCVVLGLIALQYLLSGVLDGRSIETIFTINTPRFVILFTYHLIHFFFFCFLFFLFICIIYLCLSMKSNFINL